MKWQNSSGWESGDTARLGGHGWLTSDTEEQQ